MSENDLTRQEYNDEITNLAEIIEQESQEYDQETHDMVWETVDSHQWIIYTAYHLDILKQSDSEPQEWKHMVDESDSWKDVIQVMAFRVMEQDLYEELQERENIEL